MFFFLILLTPGSRNKRFMISINSKSILIPVERYSRKVENEITFFPLSLIGQIS